MSVLAVEVDDTVGAELFFLQSKERLSKGFIKGGISKPWRQAGKATYTLLLKPLFPKLHLYAAFTWTLAVIMFGGAGTSLWWYAPGIAFASFEFFYRPTFFYLMLRMGLRKAGYRGKCRLIRQEAHLSMLAHRAIEQG